MINKLFINHYLDQSNDPERERERERKERKKGRSEWERKRGRKERGGRKEGERERKEGRRERNEDWKDIINMYMRSSNGMSPFVLNRIARLPVSFEVSVTSVIQTSSSWGAVQ